MPPYPPYHEPHPYATGPGSHPPVPPSDPALRSSWRGGPYGPENPYAWHSQRAYGCYRRGRGPRFLPLVAVGAVVFLATRHYHQQHHHQRAAGDPDREQTESAGFAGERCGPAWRRWRDERPAPEQPLPARGTNESNAGSLEDKLRAREQEWSERWEEAMRKQAQAQAAAERAGSTKWV